jgi:DNA-binding NarL/FixJ family response regulator
MTSRPARILIVDDEPLNVDYLEQDLEAHGFVTESATNGLEALERVAAAPPDLVLLDVMMPELDGISALRILKQDTETRLIPVVLMTALNAVDDRVRGIEAGADDFLSKPVSDQELLARIRTSLSLKRAIDETIGELRSTSAHLERYGKQEREIAVLVVECRLGDAGLPEEAERFIGRRRREAVESMLESVGGKPFESGTGTLAAVFDGPDPSSRAAAAVEAGLLALAGGATGAAIAAGPAQVGSTRVERAGESRWAYRAEGGPVDRASSLARRAAGGSLAVTGDVAAAVSHRFRLETVGDGVYCVLAPLMGDNGADAARPTADRRLRTILVTDVVGSTRTVERLGDRAGGGLLAAHERGTREELVLFGGEEIDAAGDGFLATFDSPARAIRCAFAVVGRAAALGLTLRVGIHTGELEPVGGKVRGIALHVASRIAARAAPEEVLVSSTTCELAAGAGLVFVDRGEQTFKGLSEPKRLFAAVEESARRPAPTTAPAVGLTAREVDVLRLVAVGLSDAEVAQQLFVSVRTVNAHLRSIYRKAGVRSRAAAGRFAEENGLLL